MHRRKVVLLAVLAGLAAGCKSEKRMQVKTDEEAPKMATMLAMSDPRAPSQLIAGWYPVESGAWRWTAGKFAVVLRAPHNADKDGAVLKLQFSLPDAVMSRVKTTALSATVNGSPLPPESYTQPGEYTYTRDVPGNLLTGDPIKVEFSLEKFLPAGMAEARELGCVVSTVGFEHK